MSSLITLMNKDGSFAVNDQYINPVGTIICFAGNLVPQGWILCDGSEISKSSYSNLFSVIGNTYGTPVNSNNFILPDLQQRLPLGKSTNNSLGDNGGNSNITLTNSQLPAHSHSGTTNNGGLHTHSATDSGHIHAYDDAYFAENTGSQNIYGTASNTDYDNDYVYRTPQPNTNTGYANISVANNGEHTHTFTTDETGGSSTINIMNPFLVLNYLIKY